MSKSKSKRTNRASIDDEIAKSMQTLAQAKGSRAAVKLASDLLRLVRAVNRARGIR